MPVGAGEVLVVSLVAGLLFREQLSGLFDAPRFQTWATIFVSVCVQALPFLVLGVTLSGLIAALVPPGAINRWLPKQPALAVPAAGVAGMGLPGCECGSVPIAGRLVASGAAAPAALTFLLAAPAVNPVVLVATAVAFPGRPEIVGARFLASMATAVVVGWIWIRIGEERFVERARQRVSPGGTRIAVFRATALHDILHAGGFLVVGGLTAATLRAVVPASILDTLGGNAVLGIAVLATLAIVVAICSEADAFVAAGLTQFSDTAKLVFMVVGPAVDVKLVALQAGTFGRSFALRFAPLTLVVAIASSVVVGAVLL